MGPASMECDVCGRKILEHWPIYIEQGYVYGRGVKECVAVVVCEICEMEGGWADGQAPDNIG